MELISKSIHIACAMSVVYPLSLLPDSFHYDGGFTYRIIRKNIKLLLFTLISLMLVGLLSSSAQASAFSMQCSENERISRIVVRTGHNEQFQFLGIECRESNGARRIFKAGIERGLRHEIPTPKEISEVRFSKATCSGVNFTNLSRICSVSFRFADSTGTSNFGSNLLTGTHKTLNGNGEVYDFVAKSVAL